MNFTETAVPSDEATELSATRPTAAVRSLDVQMAAIGSHGDVLPFVALGRELRARGHDVTIVANGYHADLVRRASLEFVEMGTVDDYRQYVTHPDVFHPIRGTRVLAPMYRRVTEAVYEYIAERYVPGRTVAVGPSTAFPARIAQEKLGVPLLTILLQPAWLFSADDPPALNPNLCWIKRAPRWGRRLCNYLIQRHMERSLGAPIQEYRDKLGLPPWKSFVDWSFSPQASVGLFPEWFAPRQPDWPNHFRTSEFPLFDGDETLPDDVEEFLDEGTPPVVFTPGSALARATPFIRAAADACRRIGRRGIILSNFGEEVDDLPAGVRRWNYVPLGALLRRAAALVHHGGIGTAAQALRAGIPQVVTPLAYDQPDNAVRLVNFGVARRVNMQSLTGRRLAVALDDVLNSADVAAACRRTTELIPKKPSLAVACEMIEGLIA